MSTSRTDSEPGSYPAPHPPRDLRADSDPVARCRRYRTEHGLFADVDQALGRIVLEIGAVGAVAMPAVLGERVHDRLDSRGMRNGPIIAHPRSSRWTFLTEPVDDSYLDTDLFADLFRECASVALPGSQIVLPSPADERNGYRIWINPPQGDYRPEFGDVVAATRAVAVRARESE
ncbi:hypothetical protein IU438_00315 [Nocardia cyriacigeorgica]|jgi:hypothetical protein|uniref:hypothetical protein n=1 Tax=Nocardia cyriacigeorgica TaxID=135487 RepID=UPI0002F739FF|nr:hypothetical protein [Nocardia cyriacigeorgica]MBF6086034.1 hypothetical protein [Nocardia cyriacigeorgica]MBF6092124.1 hypothetical protein [Nocardia cyriacigeorgica]MBF6315580.1 hypothetical protein [Nocardia cyriacigeorgica]MBF6342891.1 hypothetical protein [Nocardia cyriacigeorgica]MBF6394229.1 hypothetical protein [Nocardia cyriacigeorgica]